MEETVVFGKHPMLPNHGGKPFVVRRTGGLEPGKTDTVNICQGQIFNKKLATYDGDTFASPANLQLGKVVFGEVHKKASKGRSVSVCFVCPSLKGGKLG